MSNKTMTSVGYDLTIQRTGDRIDKITKAGVVIWPTERHTAGMGTQDKIYTAAQEEALAKERAWAQQGAEIELFKRQIAFENGANARQEGGSHYRAPGAEGQCPHCRGSIQHWDWALNLRGLEYAATKYIARWRTKGGLESLKKAIHYVQKLIEIHFPDVVVTVQYANRTESGRGGVSQTEGCAGVAQGPTSHPSAVDKEWKSPLERGDKY
jgi:hypothetical protein